MKGHNDFYFCESQMIEMVQMYFTEHVFLKNPPKVTAIKLDNRDNYSKTFIVVTEGEDET